MSFTYQNSTAVSKQIVTTASVTLNDMSDCPATTPPSPPCHGPLKTQPSVNVYLDRIFGGFMFQDPYAPKDYTREKAPACCVMLVRALLAQEKRNARFTDVPTSDPDAGEIGLLARAGVLPGNADGSFTPTGPFTRAQLAVAIEQAAHVSPSSANEALEGIPNDQAVTQEELERALERAGLAPAKTSSQPSATPLTRADAARLIFDALKDR
jgi:hypothetical protein